jgi:DNA invertase Pin-like site-specific DNA recombinase
VRLAAYIRVSTEAQAENGLGLDVQERAIKVWAKAHGHRISVWCIDEGLSGSLQAADRPGLTCALEALEAGRAEGLVVARLDRLARALTVQEAVLAHAWRHGARVFAADAGEVLRDDPDDPMRTAMRMMMGVFAQLERGMIAARLRAGRRLKAERGGYAYGPPPFGYRAEEGELVVDPDQQDSVRVMRQLRQRGLSLRAICLELEAQGVPPKRSERWHPYSVAKILARAGSQGAPARGEL